jgi:hypothetical protein
MRTAAEAVEVTEELEAARGLAVVEDSVGVGVSS